MYMQGIFLPQILEYSTLIIDRDQLTLFCYMQSLVELIIVVLGSCYRSGGIRTNIRRKNFIFDVHIIRL